MRYLIVFTLTILLFSCNKKEIDNSPVVSPSSSRSYRNVDKDLWPYFEKYEEEAKIRGINVNLDSLEISGVIVTFSNENVAGECNYNSNTPNHVRINVKTWNQVGNFLKEYIVFHELGHCERLRKHRESMDPSGSCESIMASGTQGCRPNYNSQNRTQLLDELFDAKYYGTWP